MIHAHLHVQFRGSEVRAAAAGGTRQARRCAQRPRTLYLEGTREVVLRGLAPGLHATASPSDAVILTQVAVVPLDCTPHELFVSSMTAASPILHQVGLQTWSVGCVLSSAGSYVWALAVLVTLHCRRLCNVTLADSPQSSACCACLHRVCNCTRSDWQLPESLLSSCSQQSD